MYVTIDTHIPVPYFTFYITNASSVWDEEIREKKEEFCRRGLQNTPIFLTLPLTKWEKQKILETESKNSWSGTGNLSNKKTEWSYLALHCNLRFLKICIYSSATVSGGPVSLRIIFLQSEYIPDQKIHVSQTIEVHRPT
jgi:hypothetical protein